MKKINLAAIALAIALLSATAQGQKRLSTHIELIQQATISDKTIKNNTWGTGLGLTIQVNPGRKLSPATDLSAFYYFSSYKLLYVNPGNTRIPSVEHLVNLFAGATYKPGSIVYFSLTGGPSFVSGQTLPGIKPAVGAYFSPSRKWKAQLAYLHIFNRGSAEDEVRNFTSLAFSLGIKLF